MCINFLSDICNRRRHTSTGRVSNSDWSIWVSMSYFRRSIALVFQMIKDDVLHEQENQMMLDTMTNCRMSERWLDKFWEIIQDCDICCCLFQLVPVN